MLYVQITVVSGLELFPRRIQFSECEPDIIGV